MDTTPSDPNRSTANMPPPPPVGGSAPQAGAGASPERKRRRSTEETASTSHAAPPAPSTFMQRVQTMEPEISRMLANVHDELFKVTSTKKPVSGDLLACCAMYTFQREKGVQRLWTNDYGRGKLEWVRLIISGKELLPLPDWLDNGVELQAFIEKTADTPRSNSSRFQIPWHANIRFERLPADAEIMSVSLVFVNPETAKIDIAPKSNTDLITLNESLVKVKGLTTADTADDLRVFLKAFCYVRFRVPMRHILRELWRQVRGPVPVEVGESDVKRYAGVDNVLLRKELRWSVKVDRRILVNLSDTAARLFGETQQGKVTMYDANVSKETMMAFIDAAAAGTQFDVLHLDPSRLTPEGILELLKLASAWDFQPLKLWMQLTLLERLCEPNHGFDLDAVKEMAQGLCRNFCDGTQQQLGIGQKMVLRGLVLLVRGVPQWAQLMTEILAHPLLKDIGGGQKLISQ